MPRCCIGDSLENSLITSDSSFYFAQIKESALAFLRCGRSFDLERQRLQAEQGDRQGKRLFSEMSASLGWWYTSATEAIDLSRRYFSLPDEIRSLLDGQPQWWSLEGLKKLLKLSIKQIQNALAKAATQVGNSLARFLKPFTAKKYLNLKESITEENWNAISQLLTEKLSVDEKQLEEIKHQAISLASEKPLTCTHLIQVLEAGEYAVDCLLPPVKGKTYTPDDIAALQQKAREEAIADFQQRINTLEKERLEQSRAVASLAAQQKQLLAKVAHLEAQLNRSGKSSKNQPPE